ncbi:MAG: hypothetical protein V3V96_13500, partial [Acidiferrobacterales bacterium]
MTPNEHARVSGLVKGNGVIAATRMERVGGVLGKFRVEGFIENTNLSAQTFNIGSHQFKGLNDLPIGRTAVFDLNGNGVSSSLVEAQGSADVTEIWNQ